MKTIIDDILCQQSHFAVSTFQDKEVKWLTTWQVTFMIHHNPLKCSFSRY